VSSPSSTASSSASSANSARTSTSVATRSCRALLERTNRIIRQLAEQEKYDLILQEAVYFNPRIDITEKVLRALNNGAR
jgi:Skp family chaperone for outer membrane proteins